MDQNERVTQLFDAALEMAPTDREAFLGVQCAGEPSLLVQIKALLEADDVASEAGFLDSGAIDLEARHVATEDQVSRAGQIFGPYKILDLIAEGGMGSVYLAERADEEYEGKVAIKLIRRGMDSGYILRRFRNERQILANLNHPNIAKLLHGGTTDDGLPYFAMEYVEGQPIDEYCNGRELDIAERLKMFREVCDAVNYAHQNLVVHRDIKPTNVLVTADGVPKLLDFGIAKLLDPKESTDPDVTVTALHAMTPEYASPEQVKGEPISTASDVYALGVLLYALLTGQHPYKLKVRTADKLMRAICEQEAERPSQNTDPQSAIYNPKSLRGDLDNIILKALRKEPSRRYTSVEQFSEDIRRHLEALPVLAHKGTFNYRASKFIRRNKVGVAAAALIVLTLAGGIIATAFEARRANRRFNEVRQLAHSILFDYHDEIAALPGSTKVRERLVTDALQYLDNLSKDAGNDVSLLRELATAYEKVAGVQGGSVAGPHVRTLSLSNLGDTRGALESMGKAQSIRERLVALKPGDQLLRYELGYCYFAIANLSLLPGSPERVVEYTNRAIPILEGCVAADPANDDCQLVLAGLYIAKAKALGNPSTANLGDTKGALEFLKRGQPVAEKFAANNPTDSEYQRSLGTVYSLAAQLAGANGNQKEALDFFLKAAMIDQRLVDLEPTNTLFKNELAVQTGNIGATLLTSGDTAGALQKFKQALAIYESLIASDPNDAASRRNAGVGYRNVAVATGLTDRAEAQKNFQSAEKIFADLTASDPNNEDVRRQWAYTYLAITRFQIKAQDFSAAIDTALMGIKIDEVLVAASPTNASARTTLALLYRQLGDSHAALGAKANKQQWSAAREAYQKALDIYQDMKTKGTLSAADSGKPAEITADIAKCDVLLAKKL